jgi:nucleotide-binding universal stress UspA family protein
MEYSTEDGQHRAWVERILVPLDLHGLSEAKVPLAVAQAQAFRAEIILLHVCPPERTTGGKISSAEVQARTFLDPLIARLRAEGIPARAVIQWGPPAAAILREVNAQHADLVILGRSMRHGLAQWLLGSVAQEVSARCPCPVLLVPPPQMRALPPPAVRSFTEDAERTGPVALSELGVRTVDVSRIIGSVGRAQELNPDFRNRRPSLAERRRHERILKLMEAGKPLPPIVLYKLGYGYYVLDGHHRVAAAKQIGQMDIEALVTEFVPLGDSQAQQVVAERRTFEWTTGLQRIGAIVPGNYPRLEAMIRAYAAEQHLTDIQEAALLWEGKVYMPVAAMLRERRLSQWFPGERTADVFLRLARFREDLAHTTGQQVDWAEACDRLLLDLQGDAGLVPGG